MQRTILALALAAAAAAPAPAQIGENRFLEGGTTCGDFATMDSVARLQALEAIEPAGGELFGADPSIAGQWADEVAAACEGHPDRPLADAAAQALGGD